MDEAVTAGRFDAGFPVIDESYLWISRSLFPFENEFN